MSTLPKISVLITSFIILSLCFSINLAAANESLESPVLQYKLVNHDKIALKWSAVEGADKYYIYRQNPETGKYSLRYGAVTGTTVIIGKLEEETEYSFIVKAVNTVDGKEITGETSNSVMLRTPAEWFLERKSNIKADDGTIKEIIYAYHYDGSGEVIVDESNYFNYPKLYYNGLAYYFKHIYSDEVDYSTFIPYDLFSININNMEKNGYQR